MEAEFKSDALDDFAADLDEHAPTDEEQWRFARTLAAYLELLQADAAFDACSEATFHVCFHAVDAAVQSVRVAIADDTCAYNDRNLILSLHEPTVRCLAARLAGVL
jgi:hypothetical protein